MVGLINSVLTALRKGDNVRDYQHASRTFVDNNYELSPKFSFLYHVVFNFTPDSGQLFTTTQKDELNLMVKSINLPSYSVQVEEHNQYNRRVYSQHKVNYNPVNVTFHDDQANTVRDMWYKYMTFYYRDSVYQQGSGSYSNNRYADVSTQRYGLAQGAPKFFNDIKIYSLNQKRFAEYTLINPIISSFNHGEHVASESNLMENTMTISYETVKYATGFVNNINPRNFGQVHYDTTPSPIGIFGRGPSNSIFFAGGAIEGADAVAADLASGNILGAITKGGLMLNNLKGTNLKDVLMKDGQRVINGVLRGKNPLSGAVFPSANITGALNPTSFTDTSSGLGYAGFGSVSSNGENVWTADNSYEPDDWDIGSTDYMPYTPTSGSPKISQYTAAGSGVDLTMQDEINNGIQTRYQNSVQTVKNEINSTGTISNTSKQATDAARQAQQYKNLTGKAPAIPAAPPPPTIDPNAWTQANYWRNYDESIQSLTDSGVIPPGDSI